MNISLTSYSSQARSLYYCSNEEPHCEVIKQKAIEEEAPQMASTLQPAATITSGSVAQRSDSAAPLQRAAVDDTPIRG
jgi:hypothetical protein